jgi:hypothetical protein
MSRGSKTVPVWKRPGERTSQPRTLDELFDRVVVCPSSCWLWAGGTSGDLGRGGGYGRILRPGTRNAMAAHRYVYETFVGPIPPGYQVDHKCRAWAVYPRLARLCCNPDHLEAVSHEVNMARRDAANGRAAPAEILEPGWSLEDALMDDSMFEAA